MSEPETTANYGYTVIWSDEHKAYWRPKGCGYTADVSLAGAWPHDEAVRMTEGFCSEKQIQLVPLKSDPKIHQGAQPHTPDARLLERIVRSARAHLRQRGQKHARWIAVAETIGMPEEDARELCRRFMVDPDEQVAR